MPATEAFTEIALSLPAAVGVRLDGRPVLGGPRGSLNRIVMNAPSTRAGDNADAPVDG